MPAKPKTKAAAKSKGKGNWSKGMRSPNPKGRPKGHREMMEYCREYTPEAIDTIVEIMRDDLESGKTRLAAAETLLARGWGKAPQAHLVKLTEDGDDEGNGKVLESRSQVLNALAALFDVDEEERQMIDVTPDSTSS